MHLPTPSPDHTVIRFAGADALSFLQSQLTNDVAVLSVGGWQWQGYCSAKGRLQATFALARLDADDFAAIVHQSVAATLAKRLTMFRLRAKLSIELGGTVVAMLHLAPPDAVVGDITRLATLDLGHGRWITLETSPAHTDAGNTSVTPPESFMQHWNFIGIEAMQPEITAPTADLFVPQMLNWDHVQPGGGVSFSKGCYPGQEVVARAHYRGAVKRHLERVSMADAVAADAGTEATLADGREVQLCNVAPTPASPHQLTALAVVAGSAD